MSVVDLFAYISVVIENIIVMETLRNCNEDRNGGPPMLEGDQL